MKVRRLFIYPIKSMGAVEVKSALLTSAGFQHDRSFVLIKDTSPDKEGLFEHITIKTTSRLCLFHQTINEDQSMLTVTFTMHGKPVESVTLPLSPDLADLEDAQKYTVSIFGTHITGSDLGEKFAEFFSRHLGQPARLIWAKDMRDVPLPGLTPKITRPSIAGWLGLDRLAQEELHPQNKIHFADASPTLITTSVSEADARSRLPESAREEDLIQRFRPNIHLGPDNSSENKDEDLSDPYIEDTWKSISIVSRDSQQELFVDLVFKTPRCMSLNVDYNTGGLIEPEKQIYKLLLKDRRVNKAFPVKPCFGVYGFVKPVGVVLQVGDEVSVIEKTST